MDATQLTHILRKCGCFDDKARTQDGFFATAIYANFMAEQVGNRSSASWKTAEYIIVNDCPHDKIGVLLTRWLLVTRKVYQQYLLVYNTQTKKYDIFDGEGICLGDESQLGKILKNYSQDIFSKFESWLTSENNPDYTGHQKYVGYPRALVKLAEFMFSQNIIDDAELNDEDPNKYVAWVQAYEASEAAKNFDSTRNSSNAGIAALKKYVLYIKYLTTPRAVAFDYATTKLWAMNKIYYGVPGCGKSYHIQHNILEKGNYEPQNIIRTTFYQDYSNTDFVGQILPKVTKSENGATDTVEYIFNPGPFTLALMRAISNPTKKVALVVEEINRGNAPAIFGDIFQLLDRDHNGISEYGIVNVALIDYLNAQEFVVDGTKKRYTFQDIKIPGNMDIFATMNTSDQNVFTLDTAFSRRWVKERIANSTNGHEIANFLVPGMERYTWGAFVDAINTQIQNRIDDLQVNEDKQVGTFFVKPSDLFAPGYGMTDEYKTQKALAFAHKVLEYLWDDVSKLDHSVIFNPSYKTFEKVVEGYLKNGAAVFNSEIFKTKSV